MYVHYSCLQMQISKHNYPNQKLSNALLIDLF